jgi:hypothetical protein
LAFSTPHRASLPFEKFPRDELHVIDANLWRDRKFMQDRCLG